MEPSDNEFRNRIRGTFFGEFVKGAVMVLVAAIVLAIFAGLAVWLFATDFVDQHEAGYKFDRRNGEVTILERDGYFVTWPILVNIHTVDLRPMQVCINANNRVLNCKLVQFVPDGLRVFISWHGRKNYDGDDVGVGSFKDILTSYAFDPNGRNYPFLKILKELKNEEIGLPNDTKR